MAKDLGALSTLASLHLAASGQPAYNFVEFISHKRKYILATDAGIAARRRVASFLSAEALCSLRRPSLHADWSKMQTLFDAGILVCPDSDLPVFDTTNAPPSLWAFFTSLAEALNAPSEAANAVAAAAAEKVASELREHATVTRRAAKKRPRSLGATESS